MIIYLGRLSPIASSDQPGASGPCQRSYSVLLRMGFTWTHAVTSTAVVSYTAFPTLLPQAEVCRGGIFLLHFPWSHLHRTLSGILPYEARTFLTCCLSAIAAAIICPTFIYLLYVKTTSPDKFTKDGIIGNII